MLAGTLLSAYNTQKNAAARKQSERCEGDDSDEDADDDGYGEVVLTDWCNNVLQ